MSLDLFDQDYARVLFLFRDVMNVFGGFSIRLLEGLGGGSRCVVWAAGEGTPVCDHGVLMYTGEMLCVRER